MTLRDFLNNANNVIDAVNKHKDLIDFLNRVASYNDAYINFYKLLRKSFVPNDSGATYNKMNELNSQIKSQDNKTLSVIRQYRPFDLFTQLQSLITGLKQIEIFGEDLDIFLNNDIQKLINLHTDAYSEKNFDEIFSFVSYCNPFVTKLNRYVYTAYVFKSGLKMEIEAIPEKNRIVDIQIISNLNDLESFSLFLRFIDSLYHDLCKSYVVHYNDFPLNIIKVESGSIWAKLLGHESIVQLIKDLIFGLANYIRDLQTGKIDREKFENQVKKADLVLDLIGKGKEYGLGSDNQVLLEKIFEQAIQNFYKALPKNTTEIIIDEEMLLNLSQSEQKAIEAKEPLMLNSKNEDNKPCA